MHVLNSAAKDSNGDFWEIAKDAKLTKASTAFRTKEVPARKCSIFAGLTEHHERGANEI
jgi:hypothetical protein